MLHKNAANQVVHLAQFSVGVKIDCRRKTSTPEPAMRARFGAQVVQVVHSAINDQSVRGLMVTLRLAVKLARSKMRTVLLRVVQVSQTEGVAADGLSKR